MRLLIDTTTWFQDWIFNVDLLLPTWCTTTLHLVTHPNMLIQPRHLSQVFNLFLHPQIGLTYASLLQATVNEDCIFAVWFTAISQHQSLFWILQNDISLATPAHITVAASLRWNWSLIELCALMYLLGLIWLHPLNLIARRLSTNTMTAASIKQFLYSWILLIFTKLETAEEALILIILWPWCFLIILSHLFNVTDNTVMFGFAEWGLPVLYGLAMLLEHCWTFGTYFLPYLVGAVSRRSNAVAALEDLAAFSILVARVLLQAIRGVIVGMFHYITRELLWNMNQYWTHDNLLNAATNMQNADVAKTRPILQGLTDILVTSSSLVVITAIMFLQLLFLLISVWLFCKCWFSSWKNVKITPQV